MSLSIAVVGCSHGQHTKLTIPLADVLVHTGDYSRRGDESDAISFLKWFESQPHAIRIFCCGNHERFAETRPKAFAELVAQHAPSCHYLHDRSIELGGLKWYGANWTPEFCNWHFMARRGLEIREHWDLIPEDTQVLITHGPSYGRLDLVPAEYVENGRDRHQGCEELSEAIKRLKDLKAHLHSHLHSQGCQTEVIDGVTYVNAAVVDEDYRVRGEIQVIHL